MKCSGGESCHKTSRPDELKMDMSGGESSLRDEPACCSEDEVERRRVTPYDEPAAELKMDMSGGESSLKDKQACCLKII